MHEEQTTETERVDRRGMLRKASAVVAGAAGAAVAGAAAATPAHAAPGDPVTQGQVNDALTSTTTLKTNTTTSAGPTLALENAAYTNDGTYSYGGAALALKPSTAFNLPATTPPGSMMMDAGGNLALAVPGDGGVYPYEYVYHSLSSNFTAPVNPYRALDTRSSDGRARLFGHSGDIDSYGRVTARSTVYLDISDLMTAAAGVFITVVAVRPASKGFIKVWPYGKPRPSSNAINYVEGVTLMNGTLSAVGWDDTRTDVLAVYTYATTHIILDITGVIIPHWGSLYDSPLTPAGATAAAGAQGRDEGVDSRRAALAGKVERWAKDRG